MKHEHKAECEHEISYCKKCDVVECKKCGKEWVEKKGCEQLTPEWTPTYPSMPVNSSYICPACRQLVLDNVIHTCGGTPNITFYCSHK